MDITQVAKEIRAILKGTFRNTKFSIRSSRFSQGSAVVVSWIDGPTTAQVDTLISGYSNDRIRFIETSRKYSAEMINKAIATWKEQNPQYACLTVTCEGEISYSAEFNLSEFSNKFDLQDCERSLYDIIFDSAFDGTSLILSQKETDNCEPEAVNVPEPELPETVIQPQLSQLDELKSELAQVDKELAQRAETMKKLNERAAELRAKIKVATVSEPLKTEKLKQQESTTTNMTVNSLESVFLYSDPYRLDFRQLKRLAKGKGITVEGRTKEAYISQIKAALDKQTN